MLQYLPGATPQEGLIVVPPGETWFHRYWVEFEFEAKVFSEKLLPEKVLTWGFARGSHNSNLLPSIHNSLFFIEEYMTITTQTLLYWAVAGVSFVSFALSASIS